MTPLEAVTRMADLDVPFDVMTPVLRLDYTDEEIQSAYTAITNTHDTVKINNGWYLQRKD